MGEPMRERDWKYLRRLHDEMLHGLCAQINRRAADIAVAEGKNPHHQYLELYRYIQDADATIGDCFNDWRRSTLGLKVIHLRRHGLLTDEHLEGLSPEAQDWLRMVEGKTS